MARVVVIDARDAVAELLVERLRESPSVEACQRAPTGEDGFAGLLSGGPLALLEEQEMDTVVYAPPPDERRPWRRLADAERSSRRRRRARQALHTALQRGRLRRRAPHIGFLSESRILLRQDKRRWRTAGSNSNRSPASISARRRARGSSSCARPCPSRAGKTTSAAFCKDARRSCCRATTPRSNCSPGDLPAVRRAVEAARAASTTRARRGRAPAGGATAGGRAAPPVPRTLQRVAPRARRAGSCSPSHSSLHTYSWTVSNRKIKRAGLHAAPYERRRRARVARRGGAGRRANGHAPSAPARPKRTTTTSGWTRVTSRLRSDLFSSCPTTLAGRVEGWNESPSRAAPSSSAFIEASCLGLVMTLHCCPAARRYPRFLIHRA